MVERERERGVMSKKKKEREREGRDGVKLEWRPKPEHLGDGFIGSCGRSTVISLFFKNVVLIL